MSGPSRGELLQMAGRPGEIGGGDRRVRDRVDAGVGRVRVRLADCPGRREQAVTEFAIAGQQLRHQARAGFDSPGSEIELDQRREQHRIVAGGFPIQVIPRHQHVAGCHGRAGEDGAAVRGRRGLRRTAWRSASSASAMRSSDCRSS